MNNEFINTTQAAERLGVTIRAVQKMIESERLPAFRVGRDYIINASSLNAITRQPAGRPLKNKGAVTGSGVNHDAKEDKSKHRTGLTKKDG